MLLPNVFMSVLSASKSVSAKLKILANVANDKTDTSWSVDCDQEVSLDSEVMRDIK